MKNPLRKRLFRELISELGKYLAIFLFLAATIGFVSGFLVAGGSMIKAYDESFEKYQIEDGHFVLEEEAGEEVISELEKEGVSIYPDFYHEAEVDSDLDETVDGTLRIFSERTEVNLVCLMEGELPAAQDEIAIDRMYAKNNQVAVNDTIEADGRVLTVTGLVALSDYSALFSDNGDMMFDAVKFGVAVMTKAGVGEFGTSGLHYSYSWKYEEAPEDTTEEKNLSDDFMKKLAVQAKIHSYVPRYANQAIRFTGDDMGGDRTMMVVLLYILIVILAFVFSVTIRHTIVREAAAIGTLRALGYTKGELLRHYLAMPMFVTLIAAIVGNVLGYTVFKFMVASMYYNSYSLLTYETVWNGEAFLLTTVIPLVIMSVTNVISLVRSLSLTPLKFIRRDLSRTKHKKAVRLPDFRFFTRFRLRIIFQNRANYLTLFAGIIFANILLLFGMMMSPLLSHYQDEALANRLAEYQYILKYPVELESESAQKYCVTSLRTKEEGFKEEAVTVYGIEENSRYVEWDLPENGVIISDGFAEKYRLREGDSITLWEEFGEERYTFLIGGIQDYPAALTVFLSAGQYREVFDLKEGDFNGYFSEEELTELKEEYIVSCITEDDLTKVSRQLTVSMGDMFYMVNVFAVVLAALLIYLLTRLILERNTGSISMVKILGYQNGEIGRLYLLATTWAVILSIGISLFVSTEVIRLIYGEMMKDYSGWLTLYIDSKIYGEMFLLGMAAYLVVALLQFRKIQRIPMDEALKNVE